MINFFKKKVLVIGAGSVGVKHITELKKLNFLVCVLDIDSNKRKLIREGIIDEFSTNSRKFAKKYFDLIVISNHGPQHYKSFLKFKNCSKNFIIEKPLAHSNEKVDNIINICIKKKLNLYIHQQREFYEHNQIKDIFKKYKEKPKHAITIGGSTCVVTNGVHVFNLVCEIFEDTPISIVSDIYDDKINPRGKNLGYYSGYVRFYFKNKKIFTIDISSETSLRNRTIIQSRNMAIETNGKTLIYNIPSQNVKSITKYQTVINSEKLNLITNDYYNGMLQNLFSNKFGKKYLKFKQKISNTFLSLLHANKNNRVGISKINKKYYSRKYNVS